MCWRQCATCAFIEKDRECYPDAQPGDNVPHMTQTNIEFYDNGQRLENISTQAMGVCWWKRYAHVQIQFL
eukprot:524555-Karenia_brevis.AAC.1